MIAFSLSAADVVFEWTAHCVTDWKFKGDENRIAS